MEIFSSLLPAIEHLGVISYWLIFLVSFAESLAFIGAIVPGGMLIVLAGFLSAQGYLDLGDLIWFAAIGAILGDSFSYWLGSKGTKFFKNENRLLTLSYLKRGERFFKKHGNKSILFGKFIGLMHPIMPFVAGLFGMKKVPFFFWDITGAFLWATSYLLLGYFFGGAASAIETWATRAGFFVLVSAGFIFALWFFIKRSKPIFSFLFSIAASTKDAVISNKDTQKLIKRYPHIFTFTKQRFNRRSFIGLPLTLILVSFIYVLLLFFGVAENVITSGPIVAADIRIANLLYAFRDMGLITFFTWVTLLGKWQIILGGATVATIILWLWRKRAYILPLWITLIGSELLVFFGKLMFHRPRPDIAYYIENGFSFPSGHATIAVAFYGFLTYVLLRESKQWERKAIIVFWGLVIILAIGLSRLYLGVHYVSDVWGGYLGGLLFLITGIALVEWIRNSRPSTTKNTKKLLSRRAKIIFVVLILAQIGFYITFALQYNPPLSTPQNKQVVVVENVLNQFQKNTLPRFTKTVFGNKQEPLNVFIIARNDTGFIQTMNRAGWRLADAATLTNVFTLAKSAVTNNSYPTAPMTPSFWNTSTHDLGFEKETAAQNVRERHHARFWKTNLQTPSGKYVYVGTASFDSGIKWLITHRINPDIDTERELLFTDLENTGLVATSRKETFVAPTLGANFSGDVFFTDGKIYLITLQN